MKNSFTCEECGYKVELPKNCTMEEAQEAIKKHFVEKHKRIIVDFEEELK